MSSADQNLLRVVRGRVLDGRTADFLEVCRKQVRDGGSARGLICFMGGYRRVAGGDEFVFVSTWESEAAALSVTGSDDQPKAATNLRNIATIDSVDRYELRPPMFRGLLDAPGAVLRLTLAKLRPGKRDALFAWLDQKEREIRATRLLLGWAIGERHVGDEHQLVAASAWPSPLTIEAVAEPGRVDMALFAAVEEFVSDVVVTAYQSIELDLPERLARLGGRRVVAARFDSESAAFTAREALTSTAGSASEAGISVARLASDAAAARVGIDRHVLVARVSVAEYAYAERTIADHGGQIILAADERMDASP